MPKEVEPAKPKKRKRGENLERIQWIKPLLERAHEDVPLTYDDLIKQYTQRGFSEDEARKMSPHDIGSTIYAMREKNVDIHRIWVYSGNDDNPSRPRRGFYLITKKDSK